MLKKTLALILLALPVTVNAATYVLTDVTFDDGGSAVGSFDAAGPVGAPQLVSYDIKTYEQDGTLRSTYIGSGGAALNGIQVLDSVNFDFLTLFWAAADGPLDPGVTAVLALDTGSSCEQDLPGGAVCTPPLNAPYRFVTAGSVNLVPIPAAAWLFGSALLGLGLVKRKKV